MIADPKTWNELADEITALRLENARLRALQAKPERQLIYLASPYGGNHCNYVRAEHDMLRLTETYPEYDFISPIISFAFAYNIYDYEKGINICLALLARCQQMWVLHDDGISKGVKIERKFAAEHNIPIRDYSDDTVR